MLERRLWDIVAGSYRSRSSKKVVLERAVGYSSKKLLRQKYEEGMCWRERRGEAIISRSTNKDVLERA